MKLGSPEWIDKSIEDSRELRTPKTPQQKKYINISKILTETEIKEIYSDIATLCHNSDHEKNGVTKIFSEYFKSHKILYTNFRRAWTYTEIDGRYNFYDLWKSPILFIEQFRFIPILDNPKESRNLKLRRKRRERRDKGIICYCAECGKKFTSIHKDTMFCSDACKMKAYRKRKAQKKIIS
jgi:hypothetical protein